MAMVLRQVLSVLLGSFLSASLCGCGGGTTPKATEVACGEALTRGQCSRCMCMGTSGHCQTTVACVACRAPYHLVVANDTAEPFRHGNCAVDCPDFVKPEMPRNALDYNGKEWPSACFNGSEVQRFFIIGDWGGILNGSGEPQTFKNRPQTVEPIDSHAQSFVARKMAEVADEKKPQFVVNVGDNFYPGGISGPGTCNAETDKTDAAGGIIFTNIFERVYQGPGLAVEWWGVLGNHDYGGYHYNVHWDQNIFYTWHSADSRWLTPALFWKRRAQFRNFTADFYFVDTNKVDTYANPNVDPEHNICSRSHNQPPQELGCNGTNITSPDSCWTFFDDLWKEQKKWLAEQLQSSDAEWQIIVTHYPPHFEPCRSEVWMSYLAEYGVDFYISGHTHLQSASVFEGTPFVISGGGGGITSEILPEAKEGRDDGYGFMDVEINHQEMTVTRYSHGGVDGQTIIRGVSKVTPRKARTTQVVI